MLTVQVLPRGGLPRRLSEKGRGNDLCTQPGISWRWRLFFLFSFAFQICPRGQFQESFREEVICEPNPEVTEVTRSHTIVGAKEVPPGENNSKWLWQIMCWELICFYGMPYGLTMVGKCNSTVLYFDLGPRSPSMMPGWTASQLEHRLEEMLFSWNCEWKLGLESSSDTVPKVAFHIGEYLHFSASLPQLLCGWKRCHLWLSKRSNIISRGSMEWKVGILECSITVRVVRNGAWDLGLPDQQIQVSQLRLTPSWVEWWYYLNSLFVLPSLSQVGFNSLK